MGMLGSWQCETCGKQHMALAGKCGRCGVRKGTADDGSVKQFVATYATLRSAHDFNRDAQKLARSGWRVASQASAQIGTGHNITQITVTYARD